MDSKNITYSYFPLINLTKIFWTRLRILTNSVAYTGNRRMFNTNRHDKTTQKTSQKSNQQAEASSKWLCLCWTNCPVHHFITSVWQIRSGTSNKIYPLNIRNLLEKTFLKVKMIWKKLMKNPHKVLPQVSYTRIYSIYSSLLLQRLLVKVVLINPSRIKEKNQFDLNQLDGLEIGF